MPPTAKITLVKSFTYRDLPEEWSNTYHFTGTTPANIGQWKTCALEFFAHERKCYLDNHVLVQAYGYAPGAEVSSAQIDFRQDPEVDRRGTLQIEGDNKRIAGDQAAWFRLYIGQSSTGKKVYIRKYIHGGTVLADDPDECSAVWKLRLGQACLSLGNGENMSGRKWAGPNGQEASQPGWSRYVTTRTLKRRGKRPTQG